MDKKILSQGNELERTEKPKCPFHKTLQMLAALERGEMPYRKLIEQSRAAFDGVLKLLPSHPIQRRALGSYISSEIFWENFQGQEIDLESARSQISAGIDAYDAALDCAASHIRSVLGADGSLIAGSQDEFKISIIKTLTDILASVTRKDQQGNTPEKQMWQEVVNALGVIASFCELLEKLHKEKYGKNITWADFLRTVYSNDFQKIWIQLANNSEMVGRKLVFNDVVSNSREIGAGIRYEIDLTQFGLQKIDSEGETYFQIIDHKNLERGIFMQELIKEQRNINLKVRCPALILTGTSPVSGEQVTLVQAMTEWFIKECVVPLIQFRNNLRKIL